jgi:transposase
MAAIQFQTVSEEIFARYLDGANYLWDYEPDISGQVKKPDFRIHHNGEPVYSDVKQREATPEQLREYEREVEAMMAGNPPKSHARHFARLRRAFRMRSCRRLTQRGIMRDANLTDGDL